MAGQSGQGSAPPAPAQAAPGKTSLFVSGFIFLKIGPHTPPPLGCVKNCSSSRIYLHTGFILKALSPLELNTEFKGLNSDLSKRKSTET